MHKVNKSFRISEQRQLIYAYIGVQQDFFFAMYLHFVSPHNSRSIMNLNECIVGIIFFQALYEGPGDHSSLNPLFI